MKKDLGLASGLNTYQGKITFPALAQLFKLPLLSVNEVISKL